MLDNLQKILLQVNKPARYIGNEINSIKKDLNKIKLKIALCFPDLYEIGMSHLGIRILYHLLNSKTDIACERVFAPGRDLEDILRNNRLSLFSLESKIPLKEFDILGFSLNYELNYTNVLNVLDLAGLPLKQSERWDMFPLVIAGGNCCLNPEPLAEFFDLFVIGEAEEAILEIIKIVKKYKDATNQKKSKKDLLYELAKIEGVYVPCLYEVEHFKSGIMKKISPKEKNIPNTIKKRFIKNLDKSYYPNSWIVPYISIVHDRIALELMRGCPNQCLFCQARTSFWPLRMRSVNKLLDIADLLYKSSGYEEISLLSLSSSDYPDISRLVKSLITKFEKDAVSLSLPSLRVKSIIGDLVEFIVKVRKTALTFAPEAGTQRLRNVIGKNFDDKELFDAVRSAKDLGYRKVKLYFMIGLPTETKEDLDGIIDLIHTISDKNRIRLTVSISNFIPKAHTPFQWLNMDTIDTLCQKQGYLASGIKRRKLKVKLDFHNIYMSYLEGVFARGDRRLSAVIFDAFKNGSRFESWRNDFNFAIWQEAFRNNSLDSNFYCNRSIDFKEILAWEHINISLDKRYLFKQLENTLTKQ